ncbi:DEAD/DEAH box helicase family protein, partial [Romboutsia ilealis]|uniref:DEAD/DEAH box helicase family protein n=1 Tax=Romboutsia ilealis TaxID=1115758 RepID=UPI002572233A
MYFSIKEKLKKELNEFLVKFNVENNTEIEPFKDEDLKKIALWNATGSGKTLIMHMNILQYKYYINHYNESKNLNKIIILTP